MKKKLLSLAFLLMATCLAISIGINIDLVSDKEESVHAEVAVDYYGNVNRSVDLYEQAVGPYKIKTAELEGREFSVYSDDYAGVFIDEQGILNVGIVASDSQIRKKQTASPYGKQLIYKRYAFSYNYLQKIMITIETIMNDYNVLSVGIDDKYNHVFVELNYESDVAQIISYLEKENLYEKTALAFNVEQKARVKEDTNAYGGESLSGGGTRGTMTVNAICNITGQIGILTNEHVAPLGTAMNYRGHFNVGTSTHSDNIPMGTSLRAQNGGTIDAAFVPFANQYHWGMTQHAKYDTTTYSNVRLGNNNHIIRGQPVRRIGQTTGVTTGEIRSANASCLGKTNTFRYTNDGLGGDSGGPVYFDDGTNLHLIGMHFATGYVFLGGDQGYACRITNVMNELDVTPITNDTLSTTNLSGGNIRLDAVNFTITGEFTIPEEINGRTVTSIGDSAFINQTGITGIKIPNTVTEIGDTAFYGLSNLNSVVFLGASQIDTIGDAAFSDCESLNFIEIPYTITSIGIMPFYNTGIWNNTPDDSVVYANRWVVGYKGTLSGTLEIAEDTLGFSEMALYGCWLTSISIPFVGAMKYGTTNTHFGYIFGADNYSENSTHIAPSLETVIITGAGNLYKRDIASHAFYECTSLTSIIINNGVENIEYYAFYGCTGLNDIIIPNNVTTISPNAFSGCTELSATWHYNYSLTASNLNLTDYLTAVDFEGVSQISESAFQNCTRLTDIIIPNGVTSIGQTAFYGCTELVEIIIPNSVETIGEGAFENCTSLTDIILPDSVESIGEYGFFGCTGLNEITIPDSVESIETSAFQNCVNLETVSIHRPSSSDITTLGINAFNGTDLLAIFVPDLASQMAYIAANNWSDYSAKIFVHDTTLGLDYTLINGDTEYSVKRGTAIDNTITIPEIYNGLLVTEIGNDAFADCSSITDITIPVSVESIGDCAFANCTSLSSVDIPSSVISIGTSAFSGCTGLLSINVDSNNSYFSSKDGILYNKGETAFIHIPQAAVGTEGSVTVPLGITEISDNAFAERTGITSINLPDSIESIGNSAFSGCTGITSLTIPNSVTSIGATAFENCNDLLIKWYYNTALAFPAQCKDKVTEVIITGEIMAIPENAFLYFQGLNSVIISEGVINIGNYAFYQCTQLSTITIPNSVTNIGNNTFYNCIELIEIKIPNSIESIGEGSFHGCTGLTDITIPYSVLSIGGGAFEDCANLETITILRDSLSGITTLGAEAFNSMAVPSIYVLDAASETAYRSATNWSSYSANIFSIGLEYTLINGGEAYSVVLGTTTVDEITIPELYNSLPVTAIGAYSFSNQTNIISIVLPSSIMSIGDHAFHNCSGLTKVCIPINVTYIGNNAFQGCSNLTIYAQASSEPSGWDIDWNSWNRPVYWKSSGINNSIMSNFGYTGTSYYWNGAIGMSVDNDSYCYKRYSTYAFIGDTNITFNVRTVSKSNYFAPISGSLNFTLRNSSYTVIQTHNSSVSVSALNSVSISNGSFTINTANLDNGTYTLTLSSSFTRLWWSDSHTRTFSFVVDK